MSPLQRPSLAHHWNGSTVLFYYHMLGFSSMVLLRTHIFICIFEAMVSKKGRYNKTHKRHVSSYAFLILSFTFRHWEVVIFAGAILK